MTDDRAREGDWDRTQWKGEEPDAPRRPDEPVDTATTSPDRWTKTQWVGEGQGDAGPRDPDRMDEGENPLSGDRHTPGEEHWGRRDR